MAAGKKKELLVQIIRKNLTEGYLEEGRSIILASADEGGRKEN